MGKLSLCMIVKNEEACLEQCLRSVKDAVDEIVIADTGSTDATKEIARRYTDRVYDVVWENDFSAARNASMALASMPFILWLDADDVLEPAELDKLIKLKRSLDDGVDAVMMPYQYAFSPDGSASLVFERERIVRRASGFAFEGAVHEVMTVSGNILHADIVVRHTGSHGERSSGRNLAIYEELLAGGRKLSPREMYYYARELKNAQRFEQAQETFAAFLKEKGWIENRLDAYVQRGECLVALGRCEEAKKAYLQSLAEGAPRAEAVCALGRCMMEEEDWETAIFWYRAALLCRMPRGGAFVFPDAYGYTPLMQLCVCYDRTGQHELAAKMNEQALRIHPKDEAALKNRAYFSRILQGAASLADQEKRGWEA